MAFENKGKTISRVAGADLRTSQYCFVELNSSGQIVLAGDGEDAIGILQDAPNTGEVAEVMVGAGISKVKAGAVASVGNYVASDSTGRAVSPVTGDRRLGQFLEAPGAADEIVTMLFQKLGATS